eukprot:gene2275-2490_t
MDSPSSDQDSDQPNPIQTLLQSGLASQEPPPKKKRLVKKKSEVWDYCEEAGPRGARCKYCLADIQFTRGSGTNNLKNHILGCLACKRGMPNQQPFSSDSLRHRGVAEFEPVMSTSSFTGTILVSPELLKELVEIDLSNSTSKSSIYVLPEVLALKDEAIAHRRWFHAHPELSFEEHDTAARVVEILRSYGYTEIHENVGKTGVVAVIHGSEPGPCIALRADMDALPIAETSDVAYKSKNDGVMHACGHDGHISSLLIAAKILIAEKDSIKGSIKLIFQPAEEGYGGAKAMIDDGVLEDKYGPKVDEIYGIHIWSYLALGEIGCEDGPVMAASDRFQIVVKGQGGHGALPHTTVDAVVEAATVITSLQTIISRNTAPLDSGVITCGMINGGYGYNIVADKVEITGTCRSFTKNVQEMIKKRMHECCKGVATMYGGEVEMDYHYGYPATVNRYPTCTTAVREAAAPFVGSNRISAPQKTMGAEDFAFFLQEVPGCFFFVGAALPGELKPHHKSVFDFDERGMLVSASVFVQLIRNKLRPSGDEDA